MSRITPAFLAFLFSTSQAHALIFYQWVPDAGSGGEGMIVFDRDFLASNADGDHIVYTDPSNFITYFDNPPVLSIEFTFDNGFSIEHALGFSGLSTIQSDLDDTQFMADAGAIAGFSSGAISFDYTRVPLQIKNTYDGTSIDSIACVRLPCPQAGAHFAFSGPSLGESNTGRFVRTRSPQPGDADADGDVDLADFNLMAANFGLGPGVFGGNSIGDFNYDGDVDLTDFNILAANFGLGLGRESVGALPEPVALGWIGVIAVLARRGRDDLCRRSSL